MSVHAPCWILPILALLVPVAAKAQTCQSLQQGDEVRVGLRDSEGQVGGRLISLSDDELVYSARGSARTHHLTDLRLLEVRCRTVEPGPSRGRTGLIVGGIVGAGAGLAWGLTRSIEESNPSEASERGLAILLGVAGGGAAGALVGRLVGSAFRASHSWVDLTPEPGGGATSRIDIGVGPAGTWRVGVTIPLGN